MRHSEAGRDFLMGVGARGTCARKIARIIARKKKRMAGGEFTASARATMFSQGSRLWDRSRAHEADSDCAISVNAGYTAGRSEAASNPATPDLQAAHLICE